MFKKDIGAGKAGAGTSKKSTPPPSNKKIGSRKSWSRIDYIPSRKRGKKADGRCVADDKKNQPKSKTNIINKIFYFHRSIYLLAK